VNSMRKTWPVALLLLTAPALQAATPDELLQKYSQSARAANPGYSAPSAAAGKQFFSTRHGGDWSCTSCHTANPSVSGKHVVTGKPIAPLAPAANPQRFSDPARVEKWFRRNCNDTLRRECTAAEKADVIAYLLTLKKGG
jgi:mono/diheme cytochrome c family protein